MAEFSCWDGNQFRGTRHKIWFGISSVGKIQGRRVKEDFLADFSLLYDREDQATIACLSHVVPEVDWTRMMYWRNFVSQSIDVIDAETEKLLARIKVRSGPMKVPVGGVVSGKMSSPAIEGCGQTIPKVKLFEAEVYDMAEWREKLRPVE